MESFKLMQNGVNYSSSLGKFMGKKPVVTWISCMSHFCRGSKHIQDFSLVSVRRVKSKKLQIMCCVAHVLFWFCGLSILVSGGTADSIAIRLA